MFGYKVTYSDCWGIALISEFIFVVPEIIKIVWFTAVDTDPALNTVRMFYPMSMINFYDYEEIGKQFIYPLKALNVFEVGYWGLLIYGIHSYARKKLEIAVVIVASSYVLLFLIWLVFYIIVYN